MSSKRIFGWVCGRALVGWVADSKAVTSCDMGLTSRCLKVCLSATLLGRMEEGWLVFTNLTGPRMVFCLFSSCLARDHRTGCHCRACLLMADMLLSDCSELCAVLVTGAETSNRDLGEERWQGWGWGI